MRIARIASLAGAALGAAASAAAAEPVVVNGVALEAPVLQALERGYGVPVRPGRYWYDSVSGVWGIEGGPAAGQIHPGLQLGGPLGADASRGDTQVVINGRRLHRLDVAALQRCVPVRAGRYWVLANGIGGLENQPPSFDLAALCAPQRAGGSSTRCEDYGNGQFNCSNPRTGGGMIGEGGGRGAVFLPGGGMVMTPN